ncbi:darcynin family protein [Streptomyces griseoviridis]|uniref:Darcynin family protein n=1 Tax=Streptomyces hintoniae TaxID=3075521 RepID=A0ABU2ULS8_9ACTN|nr:MULTISPECIES: darcynin family protein [unclassified Streptomyces]MDH6700562.1 hypothetical protein [Streptomyces sp. MAA16]MDT0474230.1 darcynin family protein [Streptomyces sp. DSM 41014]
MKYGIVIRYQFAPAWLQLSREERGRYQEIFQKDVVGPYTDRLTVRHFDAEAFSADFSDFLLIETDDLEAYYYFIEGLRDSDFIARGLARIHDITIGVPDGYKGYEHRS